MKRVIGERFDKHIPAEENRMVIVEVHAPRRARTVALRVHGALKDLAHEGRIIVSEVTARRVLVGGEEQESALRVFYSEQDEKLLGEVRKALHPLACQLEVVRPVVVIVPQSVRTAS